MLLSTVAAGPTAVRNPPQRPPCSGEPTLTPQGDEGKHTPPTPAETSGTFGLKRGGLAPKGAMEHPKSKVTVLPPAGREEQNERWGIRPDRLGDHLFTSDRRGHGPDDAVNVAEDVDTDDPRELEERGFVLDGGWRLAQAGKGRVRQVDDGGMTSHRGVLHPEEHVDEHVLRAAVEAELGFTYEAVHSVYRQGPLSQDQRELRARIDARVLALSHAGGHMAQLGRALGFPVKDDGHCRAIENALARARKESA